MYLEVPVYAHLVHVGDECHVRHPLLRHCPASPSPPSCKAKAILVLVGGKYWRHPLLCHGPSPFSAPSCKAKTTLMRYISRQTFAHPTYKTKTTLMRIFRGKHLHISPNSLCIPPIKQRRHLCDIPVFRGIHLLFPPPRSWNEHGQDTLNKDDQNDLRGNHAHTAPKEIDFPLG